jgi:hypothetical protein
MFVKDAAAASRAARDSDSETVTSPTSSLKTPHLMRFPGVAYMRLNCVASGSSNASPEEGVSSAAVVSASVSVCTARGATRCARDAERAPARFVGRADADARPGATRATSAGAPRAATKAISTFARGIPNETRRAAGSASVGRFGRRRIVSLVPSDVA